MYRNKSVAVVIPAHNEERLIASTIAGIPAFVDAIFAVDDASEDETASRIAEAASRDRRVALVRHGDNRGVGASIVTGYREALARGVDMVAVLDGDGQMDPLELASLLDALVSGGADLAKGYRFRGLGARGPMPFARLVGNRVLSAATRLASGYPAALDAQCGYTAIRADALACLPFDALYPRYGFPNDLVIRALEAGLRVRSVPVRALYGAEVSGIRPFEAIPRILGLLVRARLRRAAASAAPRGALGSRAAGATDRP